MDQAMRSTRWTRRLAVVVTGAALMLLGSAPVAGAVTGSHLTTTLILPVGANLLPTGVTVDTVNHVAYVAASKSNGVAQIPGSSSTSGGVPTPGTPTNFSSALTGLNFPDNVAADLNGLVYAANYCVGANNGLCGDQSGTTAGVSQERAGTYEIDSVQISAAGGTNFKLSFVWNGTTYTTGNITCAATANNVRDAIRNATAPQAQTIPNSQSGAAVNGAGGNLPAAVTLTFANGGYGPVTGQTVLANTCTGTPSFTRTSTQGTYSPTGDSLGVCNFPSGIDTAEGATNKTRNLYIACAGSGTVKSCDLGKATDGLPLQCSSPTTITISTTGVSGTQCSPNTSCPATSVPSGVAENTSGTNNSVVVADAGNNAVVSVIGVTSPSGAPALLKPGCQPANVAVGPSVSNTSPVYVACPGTGTVAVGTVDKDGNLSFLLSPPTLSAIPNAASGGNLAASTNYHYVITALTANGETLASNDQNKSTTATNKTLNLTWSAVAGATGYRVYRCGTCAAGGENVYYAPGNVTSFSDTGTAPTNGTPPTTNTALNETTLPTPGGGTTPAPYGVATNLATSGNTLVVSDSANNVAHLYTLSGTNNQGLAFLATVNVGSVPDGVAMDGNNAFVANEGSNNVTVIDPDLVATEAAVTGTSQGPLGTGGGVAGIQNGSSGVSAGGPGKRVVVKRKSRKRVRVRCVTRRSRGRSRSARKRVSRRCVTSKGNRRKPKKLRAVHSLQHPLYPSLVPGR
jgi:hypothetical protein